MAAQNRVNLSKLDLRTLDPDLIESHLKSYEILLEEGVREIFREITPVEDYTSESWEMHFGDISWGKTEVSFYESQKLGLTYQQPLYVETKLVNKKTGEMKKQKIFIADIPVMSDRATFVISGNERVVVMQIMRAEGILFTEAKGSSKVGRKLYSVKLMPERGRWFDFEVNKAGVMAVKLLDKKPKILLTTILRALGYSSDTEIIRLLKGAEKEGNAFIENTLKKDPSTSTDEALIEIHRKLRPEDSVDLESAREFLDGLFFNKRRFYLGRVGRYQLNRKLGINVPVTPENYTLQKSDIVEIVRALIKVNNGTIRVDDMDSLSNRRVRGVGELIGERIRMGVLRMEKNIKDRMSTYSTDDLVTPAMLINSRPVIAAVNQFFGSSSVSRYMDQENILSELETKRRITAGGPGGLTKERATFSVRDVHNSHYSRLCMVTTPEGPSIGIVSHLALYARISEYGFILAPYQKVLSKLTKEDLDNPEVKGQVIIEDVIDETDHKIVVKKGEKLSDSVIKKIKAAKISVVYITPKLSKTIDFMDADAEVLKHIGPATLTIDKDGFIKEDRVFVRYNGSFVNIEPKDLDYIDINPAQIGGIGFCLIPYSYNDDPVRTLMASNMQRQAVPLIQPESPIVGTGYEKIVARASGRVVVAEEDGKVVESDASHVIVEYKKGGKKAYEVSKFTRTNQNTSFTQVARVSKGDVFNKGEIIIDGPSMVQGELALGRNLTAAYMHYEGFNYEDGIVVSERLVKDDILTSVHVHEYVQDIRETKLGDEQITRDIPNVGEYALRNLDESGIVRIGASVESKDILVGIIAPKGETELTAEEKLLRAIFGEYARDVRDNSLRVPHGESGIVIGVQVLDKDSGDKLNPGVIKQVKVWVARTSKISVGDKLTGLHGDKGVISAILPEEEMPYLEDGTPVDIVLGPSSMVKRMNLGQLQEIQTAAKAEKLGIKVEIPPFAPIDHELLDKMLKDKKIEFKEKQTLYDGRTGLPFPEAILVGRRHIIKLNHLSADKIHARSTGAYTMVTQQPLGGKAQMGGQRFGEMEVWALQAHAVPHVLHEMLTIKSDDVVGRAAAYKAIIQGQPIASPNVPESFKVLLSELRALALHLELIEPDIDDADMADMIEANMDEEELKKLREEKVDPDEVKDKDSDQKAVSKDAEAEETEIVSEAEVAEIEQNPDFEIKEEGDADLN